MNTLIDTHILLWLLFEPDRLSKSQLRFLADPLNNVSVLSLSLWEISIKFGLGKLELGVLKPNDLPALIDQMKIPILDLDTLLLSNYFSLPQVKNHRDPFDRMLIWHCINNNYSLMSNDSKFLQYRKYGLELLNEGS